jgi:2Fe-2S iron-sulfur cluster binding domain
MANLRINGRDVAVDADPDTPLLWVIWDHVNLTGTKFGCGAGLCGACTVHLDGAAIRSCITPLAALHRRFSLVTAAARQRDRAAGRCARCCDGHGVIRRRWPLRCGSELEWPPWARAGEPRRHGECLAPPAATLHSRRDHRVDHMDDAVARLHVGLGNAGVVDLKRAVDCVDRHGRTLHGVDCISRPAMSLDITLPGTT